MKYLSNPIAQPSDFFETKSVNGMLPQMKLSLALNQRKVFLYDVVDESVVFETMYYLHKIMGIDKTSSIKPPIELYISSPGGSAEDGFSLISLIESMKDSGYTINTINMGRAYSMGFALAVCGTNRYCYRYSRYMVHDASSMCAGKLESMQEDINELRNIRDIYNDIIVKYTDLSKDFLKDINDRKSDKFFSAEEALNLHIVDAII